MEENFYIRKKRIKIEAKRCNLLDKIFGLMFLPKEKAEALSFELKNPIAIHSLFVFFPFVAIWLNKGKVVDVKKISPFAFHIKPKKNFNKIIEIPINKKYKGILEKLKKKWARKELNPQMMGWSHPVYH